MIEGPLPEGYKYCPHCKSKRIHGHDIVMFGLITVWCDKCNYHFRVAQNDKAIDELIERLK